MCLKRANWWQYMFSILLLFIVLASNSSQQRIISTPQPFQHAKTVGDIKNGFVPIVQPTNHKYENHKESDLKVGDVQRTDESNTKSIAMVTPRGDKSVVTNDQSEDRSIDISLRELQTLFTDLIRIESQTGDGSIQKRSADGRSYITDLLFDGKLINRVQKFAESYILPAATGATSLQQFQNLVPAGARLFLFKGLKKWFGPIFIGVQIAKTVLLAMFLPSIIGSIGKMVGKGLVSSSGFGHPSETVEDFEFKDNPPHEEAATTGIGYNYPQQTLTANHANVESAYDAAPAANNMLSLYDIAEPKPQFSMANTYSIPEYPQHSRKETFQSKKDDFKVFHDIPASSMLLTNYDPFYSPLLSRLDSVFHQLNLDGDKEACREKLVCLMYASPGRWMPYSNLVSAQLSRELNELRKPTSDNVEILRFFKYMRAARDGQDGKNCHNIHKKCSSFTDTEQPAMLTTFNDINKLVQARKMQ